MKERIPLAYRRLVRTAALLAAVAVAGLSGCDNRIPIVVTIHGLEDPQTTLDLTTTLSQGQPRKTRLEKPSAPFVVYLPADAQGSLRLTVEGQNSELCLVQGTTELAVDHSTSPQQAVIELSPATCPQYNLTVRVTGPGRIDLRDKDLPPCVGDEDGTTCTYSFARGTRLTLSGREEGPSILQQSWKPPCSLTGDGCALVMDKDLEVKTSFSPLACRPGGSCEVDAQDGPPPFIISADGKWAAGSKGKILYYWTGKWELAYNLTNDAIYALWGAGSTAWAMTNHEILLCNIGAMPLCTPYALKNPRTLYGFGGDDASAPSFWAADKETIYRCTNKACSETPVSSLRLDLPSGVAPEIFSITADTGKAAVVAGSYYQAAGNACIYFIAQCRGTVCNPPSTLPSGTGQCNDVTGFRFRTQLRDALTIWIYRELPQKTVSYSDGHAKYYSTSDSLRIAASMRAKDSFGVPGLAWLVGAAGQIRRGPPGNLAPLNTSITNDLSAVWTDNANGAWIAGSQGALFYVNSAGTVKRLVTNLSAALDVVYGDNAGNVWALSQKDGSHVRCSTTSCKLAANVLP